MIFEQVATGGCQSYLVGCADTTRAAALDGGLRIWREGGLPLER